MLDTRVYELKMGTSDSRWNTVLVKSFEVSYGVLVFDAGQRLNLSPHNSRHVIVTVKIEQINFYIHFLTDFADR